MHHKEITCDVKCQCCGALNVRQVTSPLLTVSEYFAEAGSECALSTLVCSLAVPLELSCMAPDDCRDVVFVKNDWNKTLKRRSMDRENG